MLDYIVKTERHSQFVAVDFILEVNPLFLYIIARKCQKKEA